MNAPANVLDIRSIDGPPFAAIDERLDALDPGDEFLLINGFEPRPLYDVLDRRDLEYMTERHGDGEWHVTVRRPVPNDSANGT